MISGVLSNLCVLKAYRDVTKVEVENEHSMTWWCTLDLFYPGNSQQGPAKSLTFVAGFLQAEALEIGMTLASRKRTVR